MDDRAKKTIITLVALVLFLFPGIALLCFGLLNAVDSVLGFYVFAKDLNTYLLFIFGGICGGSLLILVSIIMVILAFRKKKADQPNTIIDVTPTPASPIPSVPPETPSPPPDEPIPPTS